jgi:hypothetical protein
MDRTLTINVPYQAGAQTPAKIDGIPGDGKRGPLYLKKLLVRVNLVLLSASTSAAVTGRRQVEIIGNMLLKPKQGPAILENLSGAGLRWIQRTLTGRKPNDPADIAANSNATHTVSFVYEIPFADRRSKEKMDGAQPMAWLAEGSFVTTFAAANLFGTGQTIQSSSSVDYILCYDEMIETHQAGKRVQYSQVGLAKLLGDTIPAGAFTDVLLIPLNGGTNQAETDFADVRLDNDGDIIHQSTDPDAIVDAFNETMVYDVDSFCPLLSATQPEEFPLLWPGWQYDMADVTVSTQRLRTYLEGGSAPPSSDARQYLIRRFVAQDTVDVANQVAATSGKDAGTLAQGLDAANKLPPADAQHVVKIPTNSDVAIRGVKAALWAPFLPRRVNPVALEAVAVAANPAKG